MASKMLFADQSSFGKDGPYISLPAMAHIVTRYIRNSNPTNSTHPMGLTKSRPQDCTTAQCGRLDSLRLHAICCILFPGDINMQAYQITSTSTDTSTS